MPVQILYVGFDVAPTSRSYSFRVTDGAKEARNFTVKVLLNAFRGTQLKFQDGPELCHGRLKRELQAESVESPAKPNLSVEEWDAEDFLRTRYPRRHR